MLYIYSVMLKNNNSSELCCAKITNFVIKITNIDSKKEYKIVMDFFNNIM